MKIQPASPSFLADQRLEPPRVQKVLTDMKDTAQKILLDVKSAALYTLGILAGVYILKMGSPFLFSHLEVFKNPDVIILCQAVTSLASVVAIATIWLAVLGIHILKAPNPKEIA